MPPQMPLFYSLPRSTDTLGTRLQVLSLPFLCLTIFIINTLLASFFYKKEKLAAQLLVTGAATAAFLLFITYIKILFLVA